MMEDKIYLTTDGLDEYKNEIEILKAKLSKINTEKSEAYSGAIGDGWHNNFLYEDGSIDIDKFKLTGNWKSKDCDYYQEITLNSPLGKAIYMKKIESKVEYIVNDKLIVVDILKKIV